VITWLLGGALGAEGTLGWAAPQWVVLTAVITALAAWTFALLGDRPLLSRVAELSAWALALAGVVVALADPLWIEEEGRQEAGRVAVLVDGSASMGVIEDGRARSSAVDPLLAQLDAKTGGHELFHFGADLAVGRPAEYVLSGTDIEGALDALSERLAGEQLAAVVVLTDGLDRGLLRKRYRSDPDAQPPTLLGPLTVVQVGTRDDVVDLAVRSVDSGGYAFLRSPFPVSAEIEGIGLEGRTVTATLEQDGATVTQRQVQLDELGRGTATFEVTPGSAGRFSYAVRVPVVEGDAVPANNVMPIVVRVVRDRIRVLQVAGAPSWDVKFLRRFLKGDPSVQLVSFFILRTTTDLATSYRDDELSLIQFPYRRLFDEDLWSFDVVVFQNFDHRPYFGAEAPVLLDNLAQYVEQGGALVMVGGDRSFSLGDYASTAVESVLPVVIQEGSEPSLAQFSPRLTPEGERHPVTRLAAEARENAAWWGRLHPMDGTNVLQGASPNSAVLLDHPTLRTADGTPAPILAVREVGAGRTMALTVDSSWRWSMSEAAQGRGNQAYLRFWKNALRWLMKDGSAARVTVETSRENFAVGDDVRVVVRARDPGFAPLEGADVRLEVQSSSGSATFHATTGPDGDAVVVVPTENPGTHRVIATVDEGAVGTDSTVFAATSRDPELQEVAPDVAFLEWLALRTEGRFVGLDEPLTVLMDPSAGRTVRERRETPLARSPLLAGWIMLFAGLGWLVRRRAGLR
jgi:uncharacterized membrane protein